MLKNDIMNICQQLYSSNAIMNVGTAYRSAIYIIIICIF